MHLREIPRNDQKICIKFDFPRTWVGLMTPDCLCWDLNKRWLPSSQPPFGWSRNVPDPPPPTQQKYTRTSIKFQGVHIKWSMLTEKEGVLFPSSKWRNWRYRKPTSERTLVLYSGNERNDILIPSRRSFLLLVQALRIIWDDLNGLWTMGIQQTRQELTSQCRSWTNIAPPKSHDRFDLMTPWAFKRWQNPTEATNMAMKSMK